LESLKAAVVGGDVDKLKKDSREAVSNNMNPLEALEQGL